MTENCPECRGSYKQIGLHWYHSDCGYPELTDRQKEICIGLTLGDAGVYNNGKNPHIILGMTNRSFLEWVDDEMGILTTGVTLSKTAKTQAKKARESGFQEDADEENYQDLYSLTFRNHPYYHNLREWYTEDGIEWPETIDLTPLTLKMLYISDGHINHDRRTDISRPTIRIASANEMNNPEKVERMFKQKGFNPTWINHNFAFSCDESEDMWNYMGSPPPGFEYKWPESWQS